MKIIGTISLLPFVLAGGCRTVSMAAPASFRHPFLHHQDSTSKVGERASTWLDLATEKKERREICTDSFQHPLLNRCRRVLDAPALSAPPKPARNDSGLRIAAIASDRFTRRDFRFSETGFGHDCSGFVLGVLAEGGHDLRPRLGTKTTASAAAIFQALQESGSVHRNKVPRVGDLVFFDNTYDRNRDGRANDLLTHVGIVEKVDADGTVSFIHKVQRGTLRYRLNLFHPHARRDPKSGKVLNHYLRYAGGRREARLSGELFHAFATVSD